MNIINDLYEYSNGNIVKTISTLFFNPNFKAILLYRMGNFLYYNFHFQLLPRIFHYHSRVFYGIDLDYRAKIGPGFKIVHGTGLVIGRYVVAGKGLTVYQGVTLGGSDGKEREYKDIIIEQPYIGNNCTIYAGSYLLGPILVGNNAVVGAGSLISKDIKSDTTVFNKRETTVKINN